MTFSKYSYASLLLVAALVVGCTTAPKTETERTNLRTEADTALKSMTTTDAELDAFAKKAYGYAVFPSIGKGAVGIGGAYGKGVVYEQGNFIGYSDMSQATIGFQLGGQTYRELICFENKQALDNFKASGFAVSANASAVALKAGAAAAAKYENGVAIFIDGESGLMAEASVGGQKFDYLPGDTFK